MKLYLSRDNKLVETENLSDKPVLIDLYNPDAEEIKSLEAFFSLRIPTRKEIQEIESSSRLYKENNAYFMTINVLKKTDNHVDLVCMTFILKENTLIVLRHDEPLSYSLFIKTINTNPPFSTACAFSLCLGALEAVIEKSADVLESISESIEALSQLTFSKKQKKTSALSQTLVSLGIQGEINSKTREALSSVTRMIVFLKFNLPKKEESRLENLTIDANDLKDHSTFLGQKVSFMLDANLGLIQIEQNNIIKIFSVVAVIFLPPTLIASIYGMNFKIMPELNLPFGYLLALIFMILSATLPYFYFKKKGWL